MIFLTLIVIVVALVFAYSKYKHSYWKNKGVVGPKPTFLVGNLGDAFTRNKHTTTVYDEIYKQYKDEPFVGVYDMYKPGVLVRDPDLVKTILVQQFNNFHDNDLGFENAPEDIFSFTPFGSKGDQWKRSRGFTTPGFTTGKVKGMLSQILMICGRLMKYLDTSKEAKSADGVELNELTAKYLAEVVALSAFGLEAEAFTNPKSEFRLLMKDTFFMDVWTNIKMTLCKYFPFIKMFTKVGFLNPDVSNWMISVVRDTIKYRQENNIQREDFLNYAMKLKNKEGSGFSDIELAATSVTIAVAGVDTTSLTLSYSLYEIAKNADIQNRLRDEISQVLSDYDGEVTYEALTKMVYLDMIVYETLRKYPAFMVMSKLCTQAVTLPLKTTKSDSLLIEPGTSVYLPVFSIQRDPAYYPNPNKFDPERFSEEGKQKQRKYTFLTFGDGPRQCLGNIFALALIKSALVTIVSKYNLAVSSKTMEPLRLNEKAVLFQPKGGIWVHIDKIDK